MLPDRLEETLRTPFYEIKSTAGWTVARMGLTVAGGIVVNLSALLGTSLCLPASLTWVNLWLALSLVLDAVHLWNERRSLGPRLVDAFTSALGAVLLAYVALAGHAALTVPLALLFATTITATIIKLGLLLEGKQAVIQLTDA